MSSSWSTFIQRNSGIKAKFTAGCIHVHKLQAVLSALVQWEHFVNSVADFHLTSQVPCWLLGKWWEIKWDGATEKWWQVQSQPDPIADNVRNVLYTRGHGGWGGWGSQTVPWLLPQASLNIRASHRTGSIFGVVGAVFSGSCWALLKYWCDMRCDGFGSWDATGRRDLGHCAPPCTACSEGQEHRRRRAEFQEYVCENVMNCCEVHCCVMRC